MAGETDAARFPQAPSRRPAEAAKPGAAEPASLAIVQAVVGMAHALDLRVCAKGVETETQLSVLRGLHCDAAQGFLLAKPMTPAEIAEQLSRERQRGSARAASLSL